MKHVLTTGPGRILGQVQVPQINVEPGRVLRKVSYRYNPFKLRVTFAISEA